MSTREYAQTLELLELHGIDHHVIGPRHGGSGVVGKARALAARLPALRRFAKPRRFDLALAHGSHELTLAARSLGIPSATAHDYEFATLQHQLGLRAATRVVFPEAIPAKRLARLGARPPKLVRYPGIKEEYYLADFEPDPAAIEGIDPAKVLAVVRTPPEVSLYHRHGNPLFARRARAARPRRVRPRRRAASNSRATGVDSGPWPPLGARPGAAVDAQSLVALADLVVSAGGTMNREAAALGTPAYTTFTGRLGAVDEMLIADGRLRPLAAASALELRKRGDVEETRVRRDPRTLLEVLLSTPRA